MPVGADELLVVVGLLEVVVGLLEVVGLEPELDVEVEVEVGGAVELEAGGEDPAGVAGAKPN